MSVFTVKLCGLRTPADARAAVAAGADAVGLICATTHRSEDALTAPQARAIAASVPTTVRRVLVSHLTDPQELIELACYVGADVIQAHGEMSLAQRQQLHALRGAFAIVQVVHVSDERALATAAGLDEHADAVLLDSRTGDRLGGTGQTHDWTLSERIVAASKTPVILAGGLRPDNVAAAIAQARPAGVDVNSGVSGADGHLDEHRARAFVATAQSALAEALA